MSTASLSQSSTRKQAQSEGGNPFQWLYDLGIKPGGFFSETKPRVESVMRNPVWSEKTRVYACLSLHTMAFQQERAVKLERGQPQPLTVKDASHETGLDRRQVCRALSALEAEGYAGQDGEWLLCWAVPRRSDAQSNVKADRTRIEYPEDLPADLVRYLRRFRVTELPAAPVLEQAKQICSKLSEYEAELLHVLKPGWLESRTRASAAPGGQKRSKTRTRVSAHIRKIETDRKQSSTSSSSGGVNGNGQPTTTTDLEIQILSECLSQYSTPDDAAVQTLWINCRAVVHDVTPQEVCEVIRAKGRLAARKDNPLGFLMVAVPNCMNGDAFRRFRSQSR